MFPYIEDDVEFAPVICFLDNIYMMDLASWQLLESIKDDCERICFVLIAKTDHTGEVILHNEASKLEIFSTLQGIDMFLDL